MAKKQQLGYKEIEERLRIIKDNHVPAEEIGYHILKGSVILPDIKKAKVY